eukprot:gene20229-22205_t
MNGLCNVDLFDRAIIYDIDFSQSHLKLKNGLSPTCVGEGLIMRPLNSDDYDKGYLDLLKQLTEVGEISKEKFLDMSCGKVIASGTMAVEYKFIHRNASRGRVEDIVVDSKYRRRHLGQLLVETLTLLSKKIGCYKTSLECTENLIPFYNQFGFDREGGRTYLCQRFFN